MPSPRFRGALVVFHCLAGVAVTALWSSNALSFSVVSLLLLAISLSLGASLRRYGWRSRYFIARLSYSGVDGQWRLLTAAGTEQRLLLDGYYLHSQLVILNFINECSYLWHFSLVIPGDATTADGLRQLRLLLARLERDNDLAAGVAECRERRCSAKM